MTTDIETIKAAIGQCLDEAFCDYIVDEDGDFYITTGISFPVWARVLDNGFVKVFTFTRFSEDKDFDEALANRMVNEIAKTYLPNAIYHVDQKLWSSYSMPVMDGFSAKNFINVIRTSSDSFKSACNACDQDGLLN
jgi:hypothetical protein